MSKHSTTVSFAILVLLLTAGAAQGLSGSSTVFSDDITDGEVKIADLANLSISTPKLRDGAVTATKLAPSLCQSFATVDGAVVTNTYSSAPVTSQRNCSGQAVQVKKLGTGNFCIKFLGSTSANAVMTPLGGGFQGGINDRVGTGACDGLASGLPGQFQVITRSNDATLADLDFTILAF